MSGEPLLTVADLRCRYGAVPVLHGASLELAAGEVLCVLGRNGAGKTTLVKAIMGLVRADGGSVRLDGEELTALPAHEVPKRGIGYVPQGRRLWGELTVRENLELGLMARNTGEGTREAALDLFPVLRERMRQRAGTLSGGEQQMLALARALCLQPAVLLLDEPTEGLMPSAVEAIRGAVRAQSARGVGVVLVEQRVDAVLPVADRVLFMENGRSREAVGVERLRREPELVRRYVGVG